MPRALADWPMSLAIITPSCIDSIERANYARDSLISLSSVTKDAYRHIIVDDIPRGKRKYNFWLPRFKQLNTARRIYNQPHMTLHRRWGRSNASALRKAVAVARDFRAGLVFIHMDDNVYVPQAETLLKFSEHAFAVNPELTQVCLTGYPILFHGSTTMSKGNRAELTVTPDRVRFDTVELRPRRYRDYTLWQAEYEDSMVEGEFWPIKLWSSVYRTEFLQELLTFASVPELRWLGAVELYYRNKENWHHFLRQHSGTMGYINMQFCGLEMHHNKHWRELIQVPNEAV